MLSMLPRRALLAGLVLAPLLAAAAPVQAASDTAMLQSYAGNYTGATTIKADPPQSVHCRLTVAPDATGISYTGRCSAGMGSFSMAGVISAKAGKIVAAMSGGMGSGGNASITVTGVKKGGGVVFSSKQNTSMNGHTGTVSSTLALQGGIWRIDFSALDSQTGKTYAGSIPFAKVAG